MSDAKHLKHSKGDVLKNQDQENLIIASNPKKSIHELLNLWKQYTTSLPNNDLTVRNIATELCTLLVKTKSFEALKVFLEALPDCHGYELNENFVRAKIHCALYRKDTRAVYKLIEENTFQEDTEDLIKVWDEAHYLDEENRRSKKLTPLARFRVRKRFPPPNSICADGLRKTNTLPKDATCYLKTWLLNHLNDPYPDANEKQQLAKISGLTQAQVKTWFANARRRGKNNEEFLKKCNEDWQVKSPNQKHQLNSPYLNLNNDAFKRGYTADHGCKALNGAAYYSPYTMPSHDYKYWQFEQQVHAALRNRLYPLHTTHALGDNFSQYYPMLDSVHHSDCEKSSCMSHEPTKILLVDANPQSEVSYQQRYYYR